MKDRKCWRLGNTRVQSKLLMWQIDFFGFGACGLDTVLLGTSTLLVHLGNASPAYQELVNDGKQNEAF